MVINAGDSELLIISPFLFMRRSGPFDIKPLYDIKPKTRQKLQGKFNLILCLAWQGCLAP